MLAAGFCTLLYPSDIFRHYIAISHTVTPKLEICDEALKKTSKCITLNETELHSDVKGKKKVKERRQCQSEIFRRRKQSANLLVLYFVTQIYGNHEE